MTSMALSRGKNVDEISHLLHINRVNKLISLIILGVILERSLVESSCSEAFDKIQEAVNNALT